MTERQPNPSTGSHGNRTAAASAAEPTPEPIAISPAVGPIPAIAVPLSPPTAQAACQPWHAAWPAARRLLRWAARRGHTNTGATATRGDTRQEKR